MAKYTFKCPECLEIWETDAGQIRPEQEEEGVAICPECLAEYQHSAHNTENSLVLRQAIKRGLMLMEGMQP
jgi:uncharacterized Zn ribbon protein